MSDLFEELINTDLAGAQLDMDKDQLREVLFTHLMKEKVMPAEEEKDGDDIYYICPRCGIAENFHYLYCPWCGQHLKGKL